MHLLFANCDQSALPSTIFMSTTSHPIGLILSVISHHGLFSQYSQPHFYLFSLAIANQKKNHSNNRNTAMFFIKLSCLSPPELTRRLARIIWNNSNVHQIQMIVLHNRLYIFRHQSRYFKKQEMIPRKYIPLMIIKGILFTPHRRIRAALTSPPFQRLIHRLGKVPHPVFVPNIANRIVQFHPPSAILIQNERSPHPPPIDECRSDLKSPIQQLSAHSHFVALDQFEPPRGIRGQFLLSQAAVVDRPRREEEGDGFGANGVEKTLNVGEVGVKVRVDGVSYDS